MRRHVTPGGLARPREGLCVRRGQRTRRARAGFPPLSHLPLGAPRGGGLLRGEFVRRCVASRRLGFCWESEGAYRVWEGLGDSVECYGRRNRVKAAVRLSCGASRCPHLWRGSGCRRGCAVPCLKLWALLVRLCARAYPPETLKPSLGGNNNRFVTYYLTD